MTILNSNLFNQFRSKREWKGIFGSISFYLVNPQVKRNEKVSSDLCLLRASSFFFSSAIIMSKCQYFWTNFHPTFLQFNLNSNQFKLQALSFKFYNQIWNLIPIKSIHCFPISGWSLGSAQQHRFVITFMKNKLVRMPSWNCGCFLLTFVWPMCAWYSMLELSHLAWRTRVRWNIMVLWLLGRTSIQTRISAEKVSEFDSLYFVRTLPLWVISVHYLFQRIGLISYTQAWLFLIEHCLRSWSLNWCAWVVKLHPVCARLCAYACVFVCVRERQRQRQRQNFFEFSSAFNLWASFKPKQAQKRIYYIFDLSAVIG